MVLESTQVSDADGLGTAVEVVLADRAGASSAE